MSTLNVESISHPTSGSLVTINGTAPSNRNLIINGAMQVAQRGTTSTSSGYQTVDRWINQFSGGAVTQSQQSLSSGDPYNEGFRHFLRLANTTSSTASSSYRDITTRVEAQNLAQSGWQYTSSTSYITVSFWARSSVAQTYYLNLQSEDGTKQTYPASFALSADTWTKVTKTIPGNSSITINNDNGLGMYVAIIPFYGTDYTDSGVTDNAWNARATGTQLPDMTSTWAGTTDATFDITGVQLEVGSVATPFEHRSYGDELAKCQRYFSKSYNATTALGTATDVGSVNVRIDASTTSTAYAHTVQWKQSMRDTPSVTLYSRGGTQDRVSNCGAGINTITGDATISSIGGIGENGLGWVLTSSSIGPAIGYHYTANAEL